MTYVRLYYLISARRRGLPGKQIFFCDATLRLPPPTFCAGLSLYVMTKFILVSGGVVSGIGKGVIGMRMQPHHRNPHV